MNALKVAGVNRPASVHDADSPTVAAPGRIARNPRIRAALSALHEALEHARDLETDAWDFSVEISTLRRLKLTNNELRQLVLCGLVEHGIEVTRRDDPARSFRQASRGPLRKESCFVLTADGAQLAEMIDQAEFSRQNNKTTAAAQHDEPRGFHSELPRSPSWDRNRLELRVGPTLVRRFNIPATNQESILAAFEEAHWPAHMDDPLPASDDASHIVRLQESVEQLNRGQHQPLVKFFCDRGGQTIGWLYRDESTDHEKP